MWLCLPSHYVILLWCFCFFPKSMFSETQFVPLILIFVSRHWKRNLYILDHKRYIWKYIYFKIQQSFLSTELFNACHDTYLSLLLKILVVIWTCFVRCTCKTFFKYLHCRQREKEDICAYFFMVSCWVYPKMWRLNEL